MGSASLDRPATSPPVAVARRRLRWRDVRGALFVLPWVIGFVVFQLIPFLASFLLSFTDWNFSRQANFVGLENYGRLLFEDKLLHRSVLNTVYYTVAHVPGSLFLAFCLALLLNQKVRAVALFRTMFYLPSITTSVATVIVWIFLFQPGGLINSGLRVFGIEGPNWLVSTTWAMPSLILMSLWTVGTPMILYLAGLQGIPESLYEAAMIDGAGWWHKLRHVTVIHLAEYMGLQATQLTIDFMDHIMDRKGR